MDWLKENHARISFVLRKLEKTGNKYKNKIFIRITADFRTEFDLLRNNFIVEVIDGEIGVYWYSADTVKGDLLFKLEDSRVKKSELTHLVASGYAYGNGNMHFRGIRQQNSGL